MIKIGDKRYNPDDIRMYYPDIFHEAYCIVLEWKSNHEPENVVFDSKADRDKTLEAMDEAFLIVKDGERIQRNMDLEMLPPLIFGDEGMGGPGGINLQ